MRAKILSRSRQIFHGRPIRPILLEGRSIGNEIGMRQSSVARYRHVSRRLLSVPATTSSQVPSTFVDLAVASKIEGEESQIATVTLRPGETLRAESASMLYMTEGIEMDTTLGDGGAFQRFMTGQNIFLTDFRYVGETSGTVALGTDFPSKILRISLSDLPENKLICQKGAYLASNLDVQIEMEFTKSLSSGFFGGQGFVLQKLTGQGDVLVKGGGMIVEKELREGEVLCVTSGSLVAFESTVDYDVQMMPGVKNVMFGGEGLFVTTLKGPGRLWLQSMPPDRMIAEIARRVPSGGGIGLGVPIGGGAGSGEDGATDGEAATPDAADDASLSGADAITASDASVEADRASTVASSDADSPSALFGDAVPDDVVDDTADTTAFSSSDPSESSFTTEEFPTDEVTFDDGQDEFASFGNDQVKDGELFDDTTSSESVGESDEGGGVLGMLSDLFSLFSGDDE